MDNNSEAKNVIIAVVLSILVIVGWNIFFPTPQPTYEQSTSETTTTSTETQEVNVFEKTETITASKALDKLGEYGSVKITTPKLTGSITLKGGRVNDLVLNKYKEQNTDDSANVRLLSPRGTENQYFIDTGWVGKKGLIPDYKTVWKASNKNLTPDNPVVLTWVNSKGVEFRKIFTIDKDYMINVKQEVVNKSSDGIEIADFASIARSVQEDGKMNLYILHDGPIGVLDGTLEEVDYDDVKDDKKISYTTSNGWLGFTDQFWLVSLIPQQDKSVNATFRHLPNGLYQADFKNKGAYLKSGEKYSYDIKVFAGAKEVPVLDKYEEQYNIPMFDRSVDFGWFYFLTKPFFYLLHFLSGLIGNVGFAILAITLLVKAVLFPLANKSYRSMAKMKVLAPRMEELKKQYGDDRQGLSQAMMKLYRDEKINPMAGCLPMLVQIPIFFSLYKVLFVTLETRHEPFIGWVTDLSAPDTPGILQGFGLFDWDVPAFLIMANLGVWPILMGISMWAQFRLNPKPTDPIQAKIFGWMPVVFTFMLATFPVGLVIYWTWNNILSMAQQYTIQKKITG
ncbi:MAG: membrane protein insertase YidC [Alphaproteobacteria bacterium]